MAAQMLCLELNGGSQDISDKFLTPMYADYKTCVPNKVVTAVETNLKLLDQMFPGKSTLLKRAAVVNLYLLVSYLTKHKKISNALKDIHKWFEKTEVKRRKDSEYKLLMTRSANGRPSLEGRFRWILSDFMAEFHRFQIVELDPQRAFNDEQKAEIFIRDDKKCQGTHCGGRIIKDGENWHADHIIAWIHGGKTEVGNGRVLCPTCNLRKGSKFWEPVNPQQ